MKPFQSVLTRKGLVGIWLFSFTVEILYERLHHGPNGTHGWAVSIFSGIILSSRA